MMTDPIIWPGGKTYAHSDGVASPLRLCRGSVECERGTFWAWPVDGYYDLHFVSDRSGRDYPEVDEVVGELLPTLTACREAAREESAWSRRNKWWFHW